MQGVVEGAQVGVHLLLQVAGQEAEALAGLHGRAGEDQPLHLALLEHAHGQDRGQEGLAGAGRSQGQGEVMAFHRLHVGLLAQGAGAQQLAALAAGQHLLGQSTVVFAPAAVEGLQGGVEIHLAELLALLPEGPQQLDQGGGALQLAGSGPHREIQTPQHDRRTGEGLQAAQGRFGLSSQG